MPGTRDTTDRTPEPAQPTSPGPAGPAEPGPTEPGPTGPELPPAADSREVEALRREAAARRRELRAVQVERDRLRERVDQADRREVERMAEERFQDASDVWTAVQLDAMRGDDGLLDLERAQAELEKLGESKPHWLKPEREPEPVRMPDLHSGARQPPEERVSFGQELRGTLRHG